MNSPYWLFSFILSSVTAEIVILHTDCHSDLSYPVSELKYSFSIYILVVILFYRVPSVTTEILILHTDCHSVLSCLYKCHNWDSNSPYWLSFSFILSSVPGTEIVILHILVVIQFYHMSSVGTEIVILHTDTCHSVLIILSSVTTEIVILHTG